MIKVYRPDGVEEEKDTVDARECVAHCGYSYEPPVLAVDDGAATDDATDDAPAAKTKKARVN